MSIEEFIKTMRKSHSMPPRGMERNSLFDEFVKIGNNALPNNVPVTLISVYTTTIYPQAIKLNNSSYYNYILWDNHFWDLYDRFLFFALYFQVTEEGNYGKIQDYLLSMSLLFLSNRFEKYPALSFIFAYKYRNKYPLAIPYNVQGGSGYQMLQEHGLAHKSDIAKWFVYFHEISHVKIDYNKQSGSHDDFNSIIFYARVLSECLEEIVFAEDKEVNEQRKEIVKIMIKNVLIDHDVKYIEELCCDVEAIMSTFFLIDDIDDVSSLFISSQYLSVFQSWLYHIEIGWDTLFQLLRKTPDENTEEITVLVPSDLMKQVSSESNSRLYMSWLIAELILRDEYPKYESLLNQAHATNFFENVELSTIFNGILSQSLSIQLVEDIFQDYNEIKEHEFKYDYITGKNEYIGWY